MATREAGAAASTDRAVRRRRRCPETEPLDDPCVEGSPVVAVLLGDEQQPVIPGRSPSRHRAAPPASSSPRAAVRPRWVAPHPPRRRGRLRRTRWWSWRSVHGRSVGGSRHHRAARRLVAVKCTVRLFSVRCRRSGGSNDARAHRWRRAHVVGVHCVPTRPVAWRGRLLTVGTSRRRTDSSARARPPVQGPGASWLDRRRDGSRPPRNRC